MAPIERKTQLHVLLSPEEGAMLTAVSDRKGLSVSDWVRQAIRHAYESDPAIQASKRPKRKG